MATSQMLEVVNDPKVQRWVRHLAAKASRKWKNSFDYEDACQDIMEHILKRLAKYDGSVTLQDFARSAAWNRYGHLIQVHGNQARILYENAERMGNDINIGGVDKSFEIMDASITLDQIEKFLHEESHKSRQFQITLTTIKSMRVGKSYRDISEETGVSEGHIRMAFMRTRRVVTPLLVR